MHASTYRGKRWHTRNQQPRNHRGLTVVFSKLDVQRQAPTEFHLSVVFSTGLSLVQWIRYWNCPMDCQWHFLTESQFWKIWCAMFCPDSQCPSNVVSAAQHVAVRSAPICEARSISEISSCLLGLRPWHIEIRQRVKKTSTTNLFGFETLKLKIRRLKLWKPTAPPRAAPSASPAGEKRRRDTFLLQSSEAQRQRGGTPPAGRVTYWFCKAKAKNQ